MTEQTPITDNWLRECDFKWRQDERQPQKHWTLSCNCVDEEFNMRHDTKIELQRSGWQNDQGKYIGDPDLWILWVTDYFERTAYVGRVRFQEQVIALAELACNYPWTPENHIYGQTWPDDTTKKRSEETLVGRRL